MLPTETEKWKACPSCFCPKPSLDTNVSRRINFVDFQISVKTEFGPWDMLLRWANWKPNMLSVRSTVCLVLQLLAISKPNVTWKQRLCWRRLLREVVSYYSGKSPKSTGVVTGASSLPLGDVPCDLCV